MSPRKPDLEPLPIWFQQGNCANLGIDAGMMVPEIGDELAEAQAKVVCISCPVEELCLSWALKNRRSDLGVYAGHTAQERVSITRKISRERHRGGR